MIPITMITGRALSISPSWPTLIEMFPESATVLLVLWVVLNEFVAFVVVLTIDVLESLAKSPNDIGQIGVSLDKQPTKKANWSGVTMVERSASIVISFTDATSPNGAHVTNHSRAVGAGSAS